MSAENHVINYDKSVKDLTSTFQQHESSVELIVKKYKDLNTQLSSLPSDFVTKLRDITKANDDMVKSQNKLNNATNEALKQSKLKAEAEIKELDAIIKKLKVEQEELKIKLQKANLSAKEAREVQNATNATNKAIVALEKANNTYNKIQAKINGTSQAYNNLAAKKQLGLDLSAKEERMLAIYQARLLRYNSILKDIDANIGKHQRNVGNYAGAWNPLNNAVNQLTRELPNAGISFQTFAMSITNNIGAMQDAIADLRAKNQQLIKDGQPTKSIIGQVAGAFFSWNTVLYIGVGLFTAFSKEIAEFFKQAFKGTSTINGLKEAKKQFNDASMEGRKNAQQEIIELNAYVNVAQNASKSTTERMNAVNKLRELYPGYFKELTDEQIMNSNLVNVTNELTNALIKRAIYTASINKMTENAGKILDLEAEIRLESDKLKVQREQVKLQADKTKTTLTTTTRDEAYHTGRLRNETDKLAGTQQRMLKLANDKKQIEEQNLFLQSKANNLANSQLNHESKSSKPEKVKKEKDTSEKDRIELAKKQIEAEYQLRKSTLEKEKAQAEALKQTDVYYTKEQELLNASYKMKNDIAELEIKDNKTLQNTKKANFEEYIKDIVELNTKEVDQADETSKKIVDTIKEYWKLRSEATKEGVEKELASKALNHEDERFAQEKDILNLRKELEGLNKDSPNYYSKLLELREAEHKYDKMHLQYLISIEKDPLRKKELQNALEALDIQFDTDKLKIAKDSLSSFEKSLSDIFSKAGFGEVANLLDGSFIDSIKNIKDWKDAAAAAMEAVSAISTEVFARMKANSDAYYENQFSLLEKEHETSIKYANNNVDAKTVLEEKYTARKLELKRQQAKQEKEMATFQALINVATGITSALTQAPPYSFILAALVGVMGAAQIASIQAQPLPQFYNGTMNASEGWAIVDELRPEVHTDRNGNLKSMGSSGGANLRYLEQGDKIYKSHADFFNEMDDATRFGGITIEKNDGLSKHDLEDVMQRVMNGIQQNSINLDVKGFTTYQGRRNSRNRILNKKVRFGK